MNSPQTLGPMTGLTLQGTHRSPILFKSKNYLTSYNATHSLISSSSVADPSHSPIERGQQQGLGRRVCAKCSGINGMGMGMGGSGDRKKEKKTGNPKDTKKGTKTWIQDSQIKLTQSLKFSQRSLDG